MARTKTTPKKEREGRTVLRTRKEWARLVREAREEGRRSEERRRWRQLARWVRNEKAKQKQPPSPVHHPSPAKSSSPMREVVQALEEMIGWVEEASRLAEVGWSPSSLPTQQLVQMAAEAGPSALGEEPAQKEAPPYHWWQGPMEGIPEGRKGQKDQEVLAWHSCPLRDPAVSEEH